MNPLIDRIDIGKMVELQNIQYSDKVLLADIIPANSSKLTKVHINGGHFMSERITGHYETISKNGDGPVVDDGFCHLRGKLRDESCNRDLFSDYIPLDLFLTPGRIKSVSSSDFFTAVTPNSVFWPDSFKYVWQDNSDISFEVKNDSNVDIRFEIVLHGIRFWRTSK